MGNEITMSRGKAFIVIAWLALVASTLCFHYAHASLPGGGLASVSMLWACVFYLLVGCMHGFTFMPLTILIGFGILFLHPVTLFILTMIGTLVSSLALYYFYSLFEVYERFQRRNKKHLDALQSGMKEFELPIIIGWSFCPMLPTDIVCCLSGVMKLSLSKLLFGVLIGEGICCAIYIFCGNQLFRFLGFGM